MMTRVLRAPHSTLDHNARSPQLRRDFTVLSLLFFTYIIKMLLKRINESENAEYISEMQRTSPASWRERGREGNMSFALFFLSHLPGI